MNTENNEPRKYKRYDDSFKRSAVELWLQGGKSIVTPTLSTKPRQRHHAEAGDWGKESAGWVSLENAVQPRMDTDVRRLQKTGGSPGR